MPTYCCCCKTKEVNPYAFCYGKYPKGFIIKPPRCAACKRHGEPCHTAAKPQEKGTA